MTTTGNHSSPASDPRTEVLETREWIESLDDVLFEGGPARVSRLLAELQIHAQKQGVPLPVTSRTPYVNTIPPDREPPYPGDRAIERRIKSLVRWNAMAMVVRANRELAGIGGHISTFASAATLYEVGFHHFFRGHDHACGGDHVHFQGHAAPGIYARAFLEGRLSEEQLHNFRRELRPGGGLASYPHPWLMPDFWEFPTVSMGLGPILSIYRARFQRYLEDRGLKDRTDAKVWCFVGDGESDEPETLGAITLASRERLDNLIWVVNCNLQRLDGPVRGNAKIVQELEAIFRGAGWNVIKALWASSWDPLFARDDEGVLVRRLGQLVDGESLKFRVESLHGGAYLREHFFGKDPRLLAMVRHLSDDELKKIGMGGHDPVKVHAAYRAAVDHRGSPTVILARTIKGYGMGEAGEGKNITHQQKKLNEEELLSFRDRFDIPISDEDARGAPFYRPPEDSDEIRYLRERRAALGGPLPRRRSVTVSVPEPGEDFFEDFLQGSGTRQVATTMAFVRMLSHMLKLPRIGPRLVPIVPDEARTFGMEALFRQCGIYSSVGQLYEPVDSKTLLYYKESKDGQILEEGITEAGSMASFIAAGTTHSVHGVPMIPVFLFYSMFGMQRIGDLVWAAGDSRARGFLVGATSGRTTLQGEGLQHQDGHSHLLADPVPNLLAYDPAYACEIAVIVQEGMRRMFHEGEDIFIYLTVGNEFYVQPPLPGAPGSEERARAREGILRGMRLLRASRRPRAGRGSSSGRTAGAAPPVQLLGSGAILNEVCRAQEILEERFAVAADVWSVTSWKELRRDALRCERGSWLHPEEPPREPYLRVALRETLAGEGGKGAAGIEGGEVRDGQRPVFVAATDFVKMLPDGIAKWLPGPLTSLGTDGFGRSDGREALRDFFEVDARHVAWAALSALAREGRVDAKTLRRARRELAIDPDRPDPVTR